MTDLSVLTPTGAGLERDLTAPVGPPSGGIAGAASALPTTARADVLIAIAPEVAVDARFRTASEHGSVDGVLGDVDAGRHYSQVVGIHAVTYPAYVVDHHAISDRASVKLPREAVSVGVPAADPHGAVPSLVGPVPVDDLFAGPQPAGVGLLNSQPEALFDWQMGRVSHD